LVWHVVLLGRVVNAHADFNMQKVNAST
jgi:hypothetical protein